MHAEPYTEEPDIDEPVLPTNGCLEITMRDYFATAALTGILANQPRFWDDECVTPTVEAFMNEEAARQAYHVADMMLKRSGAQLF